MDTLGLKSMMTTLKVKHHFLTSKVMLMEKSVQNKYINSSHKTAFIFVSEKWLEIYTSVDRYNQGEASRVRACEVSVWLSSL